MGRKMSHRINRPMNFHRPTTDGNEVALLIDRALRLHRDGQHEKANAFARCAQALFEAQYPEIARDLSYASRRKGDGTEIGERLARSLSPEPAAMATVILLLRRARAPVTNVLRSAFADDPVFSAMTRTLCASVLTPVIQPSRSTPIEVAAPRSRQ